MEPFSTDSVLEFSLELNQREQVLRDFYAKWLPKQVIDVHAHNNLPEHVEWIEDRFGRHMMSTFPYFTLEQSHAVNRILFPKTDLRSVRFSHVIGGINFREANDYLINCTDANDVVALLGIPDDIEYTLRMLNHPRIRALKMYHLYFDPPAKEIYKYFPKEVLERAEEREIPIILHLPKMITNCLEELRILLNDFPRLPIVLAHLGLPHLPVPGLFETYQEFSGYSNVYMDTAMIPSAEVVSMAIEAFGAQRIMFGSDEPLHLLRSSVYENPVLGQRLITQYLYHWVDKQEHEQYKHLAEDAIQTIWQALEALRIGIETTISTNEVEDAKQQIFHDNAARVFKF